MSHGWLKSALSPLRLAEHRNMTGIASAATSVLIGYLAYATTLHRSSGGVMLPNHFTAGDCRHSKAR